MSLVTKLRQYFRIPWVRRVRSFGSTLKPPPDTGSGSAGVPAKLPPVVPAMSGANAKPFPPED